MVYCPLCERERRPPENPLHRDRGRIPPLNVIGKITEHPVGDIGGKPLGEHVAPHLLGRNLLPAKLLPNRFADQVDLVPLAQGLRAGEHIRASGVFALKQCTRANRGDVPLMDR